MSLDRQLSSFFFAAASLTTTAVALPSEGEPLFPAAKYSTGGRSEQVRSADVDGDGCPDLVLTTTSGPGGLRVLLGSCDGTFGVPSSQFLSGVPRGIAVADLDDDGRLDVAVTRQLSGVAVAFGNGDGTFSAFDAYPVGLEPFAVVAADLDGDSVLDLAVANRLSDDVSILLGTGGGAFAPAVSIPAGSAPVALMTTDLDDDGALDLVVVGDDLGVLLGNGDGTFGGAAVQANAGGQDVAAEDIDGDGSPDVAVARSATMDVTIHFGVGDGTLGAALSFATGGQASAVHVRDVDGDLLQDVLVGNAEGTVAVLSGLGGGVLGAFDLYPCGGVTRCIDIDDFDGDGYVADRVVGSAGTDDACVLLGRGDGTFGRNAGYATSLNVFEVALADVDRDGALDVLLTVDDPPVAALGVLYGGGDGTLSAEELHAVGVGPYDVAAADLDGDGWSDAVTADLGSDAISVLVNGPGGFAPAVSYSVADEPMKVTIGDFDGDGTPDVAAACTTGDAVSVLLGNGDGTFATAVSQGTSSGPVSLAAGDVNADGVLDLAVATTSPARAELFAGAGDGTFVLLGHVPLPAMPRDVVLADLDADGVLDLVTASSGAGGDVSVALGVGDGTFAQRVDLPMPGDFSGLVVADVDGDGALDVAGVSRKNDVFLRRGDGSGNLGPREGFVIGAAPAFDLAGGDLDGDGGHDLVVPTSFGRSVGVLLNGAVREPTVYCTPKVSSAGCVTTISVSGATGPPVSGAGDTFVAASDVQAGMNGLVFTSPSGAAAIPFNGGVLCMNPPLKRGPILNAGGTPGQCDGAYATLANDGLVVPQGLDAGPGGQAQYQYYYRDPANGPGTLGSALSNAVELVFE